MTRMTLSKGTKWCPSVILAYTAASRAREAALRISLDARDLDEPFHWIAGKSQEMFHANGGRIFNMPYAASQQLGSCRGGHGTGASHFSLAANFSPGDRGIGLDQVTDKTCSGQCTEYFDLRRIGLGLEQI